MRNSFNLLLIALAMIDNTYLFSSILESCRKRFDLQTDLHLILLPYFLYPLHSMAMTGRLHLRLEFVIRHLTPNMGSFNNYVDQNLTNFDPLPPRVDKRGHFTYPVHVDKRSKQNYQYIGYFGANDDQTIRIRRFFEEIGL